MQCMFCGSQMDDDAVYCSVCGSKVDGSARQTLQPQKPLQPEMTRLPNGTGDAKPRKKPKTWLIVLLSIVGTVVLAVVGIIAYIIISVELEDDTGSPNTSTVVEESRSTDDNTGSDESLDELIALLHDAYNLYMDSGDPEEASSDVEGLAYIAESSHDVRIGLEDYQKKSEEITGLDPAARAASNALFETLSAPLQTMEDITGFLVEYDDITEGNPELDDYDTIADHYEALYDWYTEKKEKIDAVSNPPACVDSQWNTFKKDFDINREIVDKEYLADELGDYLRFYSAINLSDRYFMTEYNNLDSMSRCFDDQIWFATQQEEAASKILDEIEAYAKLSPDERAGYEFKSYQKGELYLDYECIDTIYPSLYNTYDSFAIIKTGCINGNHKIVVEAEIPGLTQKYKQSFDLGSSYKAIYVKPPALSGNINLSSAKDGQMNVSIYEQDGITLIESKTFPVKIKSRNDFEWSSDEFGVLTADNILSFLTPEAKAISDLKRTAIDELTEMTDGNMDGFAGYQYFADDEDVEEGLAPAYLADEYAITYLQAASIMRALNIEGVRYNLDPFSVSGSDQHILLPEEVLGQKSGLCVETALVVASALQSAGMHAFLVFPPGHAQVAVETWEGSGDYYLIETTAISDSVNSRDIFIDGANSVIDEEYPDGPISLLSSDEWCELLESTDEDGEYEYYIVDCDDAQVLGMTPFVN